MVIMTQPCCTDGNVNYTKIIKTTAKHGGSIEEN